MTPQLSIVILVACWLLCTELTSAWRFESPMHLLPRSPQPSVFSTPVFQSQTVPSLSPDSFGQTELIVGGTSSSGSLFVQGNNTIAVTAHTVSILGDLDCNPTPTETSSETKKTKSSAKCGKKYLSSTKNLTFRATDFALTEDLAAFRQKHKQQQKTNDFASSSLVDEVLGAYGFWGSTAFLSTDQQEVFYLSPCAMPHDIASPRRNSTKRRADVVMRLNPQTLEFEPVWRGDHFLTNASCVAVRIGTPSMARQSQEVIVLVGGLLTGSTNRETLQGQVTLSVFDPRTNDMYIDIARMPIGGGPVVHPTPAPPVPTPAPPVPAPLKGKAQSEIFLSFPTVGSTSSHLALLAGGTEVGIMTGGTGVCDRYTVQSVTVHGFYIEAFCSSKKYRSESCKFATFELTEFPLPPLPFGATAKEETGAATLAQFSTSLYFASASAETPGIVAQLELAYLGAEIVVGNWKSNQIAGDVFEWSYSTLRMIAVENGGSELKIGAFGGETSFFERPALSFSSTGSPSLPSVIQLPYSTTAFVKSQSAVNQDVSVKLLLDITRMYGGRIAISTDPSCALRYAAHFVSEWGNGVEVDLTFYDVPKNIKLPNASLLTKTQLTMPLFVCFSDAMPITFTGVKNGNITSYKTELYTVINNFQPIVIDTPSSGNGSPGDSKSFLQKEWILIALGALILFIAVALLVIFRTSFLLRHRKDTETQSTRDRAATVNQFLGPNEASKVSMLSKKSQDDNPMGTHASKYIILEAMYQLDGEESQTSILVQRKNDNEYMVMKYVPCDSDLQRLISMREFEALQASQGHPHVVTLYDMFMSYTFAEQRPSDISNGSMSGSFTVPMRMSGERINHLTEGIASASVATTAMRISQTLGSQMLGASVPIDATRESNTRLSASVNQSYTVGLVSAATGRRSDVGLAIRQSRSATDAYESGSGSKRRLLGEPRASTQSESSPLLAEPQTHDSLNSKSRESDSFSDVTRMSNNNIRNESFARNPTGRYVCLVSKYYPDGNVGQWCIHYQKNGGKPKKPKTSGGFFGLGSAKPPSAIKTSLDGVMDGTAIPEVLVRSVAAQLCSTLRHMHHEMTPPIAHKGIKIENVLVAGPLNKQHTYLPIKLSDFGFSKLGRTSPPMLMSHASPAEDHDELSSHRSFTSSHVTGAGMAFNDTLHNPKADMWCVGCVLLSMTTMMMGDDFPPLGMSLADKRNSQEDIDRLYKELRTVMRGRGYSRDLTSLILSLLHVDEKLRPSSERVAKLFVRQSDGSYQLSYK